MFEQWTTMATLVITVGGAIVVFMRVYGRMEADLKNLSEKLTTIAAQWNEWVKENRRTVEKWGERLGGIESRVDRLEGALWDRRYRRSNTPVDTDIEDV